MIPKQQIPNNEKPIGILKIKPKGKKFIVTFDDDELELTEELMVNYRVSLDKRYTKEEFKALKKDAKISQKLDKAIGFINYKMRSEKEVEDYLKKEKLSDLEIKGIMEKLKSHHFIDDKIYVNALRNDFIHKLKGYYAFKYELSLKGISDELLNEALDSFDEGLMIAELIDKYQKEQMRINNIPIVKQKEKIKESISRRGFSISTVLKVIDGIDFSEDLDDLLNQEIEKICKKTDDYNKRITYLMSKGYSYNIIKERIKK